MLHSECSLTPRSSGLAPGWHLPPSSNVERPLQRFHKDRSRLAAVMYGEMMTGGTRCTSGFHQALPNFRSRPAEEVRHGLIDLGSEAMDYF